MANSTPAGEAALNAQDKRLLTRVWVDSNSRNSKHPRPSSSWNPPRAWAGSKTTARKTDDYHKDDYKNADVKRLLTDGTIVLKGIGSEENHQNIIDRRKEGQSSRRIAEELDGSIVGHVDDIHAQGSVEDVEEGDEELGFAQDLFQTCLYVFRELCLELSELSPSPKCIRDGLLVEGLGKFYLWGDSFQDGTMDTTLAQSDELREDVLKLICQIGSILTHRLFPMVVAPSRRTKLDDAIQHLTLLSERVNAIISSSASEANSDSDDTDEERAAPSGRHKNEGTTGRDLRLLTGCLMELVPTLEQSLPRVGKLARSALLAHPPAFKVSGPAFTYVRNVYDKFPQADIRLIERLGEANWQRHVKVRNKIDQVANDEPVESKAFVVAPFSEFRDSALGSSIPNQSHYAASAASHTSFVSSLADDEERSIRAPPTPAEVSAGKPFQCHICGQNQSRIRNRVEWKIHVFADLQPYICTFSTCKDALVKFPTRKMWVDHEFGEHRVNRSWVCPDCSAESFSPHAWDEHLRQEHNIIFEGSQHAIALDSARRIISKPIDEQQCPMCKAIPGSTRRAFSTHVGRHMEQIALVVLPRETDDDLEGSSVASDAPIHDQREGSRPGPDTALNLNAESGLLNKPERSVSEDSETGHLVNANSVIRDAGTASPFSTVTELGSFVNPLKVIFNGPSRIWTDRSGSYRVEAVLLGLKDNRIVLRKLNEVKIAVPMVKMAIEDLRYVEQMTGVSLDWEKVGIRDPAGSLAGDAHGKLMQCDQCPRSFSKESELERHKRCHTKQFACKRCYKRFSRPDMLGMHTVTGHCIPSDYENDLVGSDYSENEEYIIRCYCANEEDDGNTVLCEGCYTWQHIKCYYHSSERVPEVHDCTECVPRTMKFKKTVEQLSLSPRDKVTYGTIIDSILAISDENTISASCVRKTIEETVGYDVSQYKAALNEIIFERLDKIVTEKGISLETVDKTEIVTKLDPVPETRFRKATPRNTTLAIPDSTGDGRPSRISAEVTGSLDVLAQVATQHLRETGDSITPSKAIERAENSFTEDQASTPDSTDSSKAFLKPYNEAPQLPADSSTKRPYRCAVAGCKRLSGFAYARDLLRHERAVHKVHKPHMCPYTGCVRSTGAATGFTRKENLQEHIRRVHKVVEDRPAELGAKQDIRIDTALQAPLLIPQVTRPSTQATNPPRIYNEPREEWEFDFGKDIGSRLTNTPNDPFLMDTPPSPFMSDTPYVHQSGGASRTDDCSGLDPMSEDYRDELYDSELFGPTAHQSAFVLEEPAYNPALKTATGIRKSRQADDDARILA